MHTPDFTDENIARIAELFPNCITEAEDENGKLRRVVDFDQLKQELSGNIVEGSQERYQLNWPGKREALLTANAPIAKTLRPCREESVDFDTTKNLYIEGDNLDALKLLQETYLGKVKMIYIDPPYNTGTAMLYPNDYSESIEFWRTVSGDYDDEGNQLVRNVDTDGRFHTNWLNMIYPRLRVSRNLLTDDGFLVLAIDDSEVENLIKMCDEVFGAENKIGIVSVIHKPEGRNQEKFFGTSNEFALFYAKDKATASFNSVAISDEVKATFDRHDTKGLYRPNPYVNKNHGTAGRDTSSRENRPDFWYPVYVSGDLSEIRLDKTEGFIDVYPITDGGVERTWRTNKATFLERLNDGLIFAEKINGKIQIFEKYYENQVIKTHWLDKKYHATQYGTKTLDSLMGTKTFDFPKSLYLMVDTFKLTTTKEDIVIDVFSGSATSAHALMQLNVEDGGNRRFIMVQFPEVTSETSEAFKAGYQTIAEIGKERIRRAGKKIKEEAGLMGADLDIGFRVLKIDTSNMKDVYYSPDTADQQSLLDQVTNIKEDRTPEDLLFQVLLDWGVDLSLPIVRETISGKEVFFVDENALAACFESGIDEDFVKELAKRQPLRAVFRDDGFASDAVKINVEQIFKQMSPTTEVKSI